MKQVLDFCECREPKAHIFQDWFLQTHGHSDCIQPPKVSGVIWIQLETS